MYIFFSRRQGRSARINQQTQRLAGKANLSFFSQRVSCSLLGTIPDMRRPMNNSDVCVGEILYNPRLLGVWQRKRCPATTGSRPPTGLNRRNQPGGRSIAQVPSVRYQCRRFILPWMKPWEPLLVGKICECLAAKAKRRIEGVDSQVPCRIVKISLTETLKALGCRA